MPIAKLIKSVLGLGSSDGESAESTSVTVEREPDDGAETGASAETSSSEPELDREETPEAEPDAVEDDTPEPEAVDDEATEPDVSDETDTGAVTESDETDDVATDDDVEEAAAAGTSASASTGSMTEEPPEGADAAEDAEVTGDVTDHSGTDNSAAEDAEATGPVEEEPDEGGEPVDNVTGIGPAYAERLNDAGIDTVRELLEADPEELAGQIDVSEKRIGRWQESAEDL